MAEQKTDMTDTDKVYRQQLTEMITGGNAHATFEDAIADLPAKHRGIVADGLPYSIWQLVDHIRIAQWDILEFSIDQKHQSPQWPEGYWSKQAEPTDDEAWEDCIKQIENDREKFTALINDPTKSLTEPLPHGSGQTLLRETLLIASHLSYHTGQIILVRRLLEDWEI